MAVECALKLLRKEFLDAPRCFLLLFRKPDTAPGFRLGHSPQPCVKPVWLRYTHMCNDGETRV